MSLRARRTIILAALACAAALAFIAPELVARRAASYFEKRVVREVNELFSAHSTPGAARVTLFPEFDIFSVVLASAARDRAMPFPARLEKSEALIEPMATFWAGAGSAASRTIANFIDLNLSCQPLRDKSEIH